MSDSVELDGKYFRSLLAELAAIKAELAEARDKFQQIRDDAGTPLAISAELWEFSKSRCGHNFLSAQHALTSVIAHIDRVEQERDDLRAKRAVKARNQTRRSRG